jgi:hypothetical protein
MQIRLKHAHWGALAAILLLGAPAAQAFTLGGEAANGTDNGYAAPKFDLEEQAKNFRAGGSTSTAPGKTDFSTPLGKGSVEFGVQQGPSSAFGFGPGSLGPAAGSRANRMDFERMVTPENLR